jgi:beta-carotene 15,15'-dioxygenase
MKTGWLPIQTDRRWLLSIGVGLMLLNYLLQPLPERLQWAFFIGSILLTGIPHGALDHLVVAGTDARQHRAFSMRRFLIRYLLLMTIYALIWWQWPALALLAFMGCSAYHFGETDLALLPDHHTVADRFLFIGYGWLFVSFLTLTHPAEALPILAQLPGIDVSSSQFIAVITAYAQVYSIGCGLLAVGLLVYVWRTVGIRACGVLVLQSAVLGVVIATLPLLLAFTFYFAWWHAGLSLLAIRRYVVDDVAPATNQPPAMTWAQFIRRAGLFSGLAIGGMLCFVLIGRQYATLTDLLPAFLVGIAVLTLPHMTVMSDLFAWLRGRSAA